MHPMTVSAIDAINWECIIPVALFNLRIITYKGSPVPKEQQDFQHASKL
jgi:hypothetical protein